MCTIVVSSVHLYSVHSLAPRLTDARVAKVHFRMLFLKLGENFCLALLVAGGQAQLLLPRVVL